MNKKFQRSLISENLTIGLDTLRAHKLRSGLIILGVSIGVASLMGMVSILLGLESKLTADIQSSDQVTITFSKYNFLVGGMPDHEAIMRRKNITVEDVKAVREQCPSLKNVGYLIEPMGPASAVTVRFRDEKSRMVSLIAGQPSIFYISNLEIDLGRNITDQEVLHRSKVVILGFSCRRDLFPNLDPIGKTVKIMDQDFTVIGTAAERKSVFGDMADNFVMIPYTAYLSTFWNEHDMSFGYASIREGESVETAQDEVIRVLRSRRKLKADQPNDFDVTSSDASLEMVERVTGPLAMILVAISSIGLLVGGIGVMNMMLVSVTERTGEIGLRKAVGATRQDILWQFLIEAGVLTGLGGVFGTTLGLAAAYGISRVSGLPSSISIPYILIAVVFSVAIGVFFGLYPANRASKLDPVQAMSYAK